MKISRGNLANKEDIHYYFVYMHINKVDDKKYIGVTYQNPPTKRWKNGKAYKGNSYLCEAITKYGWKMFESVILDEGYFTVKEAYLKEDYYINHYETLDSSKGYNIAPGGFSGMPPKALPASLEWMRQNPEFGLARAKDMHKWQEDNPERFREICQELQEKGAEAVKTPVVCVETGQEYESVTEASRQVKGTSQSKITLCCQGLRRTCGGLHWMYLEDYTPENAKTLLSSRRKQGGGHRKRVLCVETGEVFESVTKAAEITGLNLSAIAGCCRDTREKSSTHGGYHWRYIDMDKDKVNQRVYLTIPAKCPTCSGNTEVRETERTKTLWCTNESCQAKLLYQFKHFCSRDAMNIEGLSEATLEKLINLNLVNNFLDIFDLTKEKILKLEGFGEKSANKLLDNIEKSRQVELPNFIYALGIEGVGRSVAKVIAKHFNYDFDKIYHADVSQFESIEGIGNIIASNIRKYFSNDIVVWNLYNHEVEIIKPDQDKVEQVLLDKTFVVTGKVINFTNRKELQSEIETLGGKVVGSVSKNTNYLINNDKTSTSSKNKKAIELGVPILTEDEFVNILCKSCD